MISSSRAFIHWFNYTTSNTVRECISNLCESSSLFATDTIYENVEETGDMYSSDRA